MFIYLEKSVVTLIIALSKVEMIQVNAENVNQDTLILKVELVSKSVKI
jgi:phage gp46-like protein